MVLPGETEKHIFQPKILIFEQKSKKYFKIQKITGKLYAKIRVWVKFSMFGVQNWVVEELPRSFCNIFRPGNS